MNFRIYTFVLNYFLGRGKLFAILTKNILLKICKETFRVPGSFSHRAMRAQSKKLIHYIFYAMRQQTYEFFVVVEHHKYIYFPLCVCDE